MFFGKLLVLQLCLICVKTFTDPVARVSNKIAFADAYRTFGCYDGTNFSNGAQAFAAIPSGRMQDCVHNFTDVRDILLRSDHRLDTALFLMPFVAAIVLTVTLLISMFIVIARCCCCGCAGICSHTFSMSTRRELGLSQCSSRRSNSPISAFSPTVRVLPSTLFPAVLTQSQCQHESAGCVGNVAGDDYDTGGKSADQHKVVSRQLYSPIGPVSEPCRTTNPEICASPPLLSSGSSIVSTSPYIFSNYFRFWCSCFRCLLVAVAACTGIYTICLCVQFALRFPTLSLPSAARDFLSEMETDIEALRTALTLDTVPPSMVSSTRHTYVPPLTEKDFDVGFHNLTQHYVQKYGDTFALVTRIFLGVNLAFGFIPLILTVIASSSLKRKGSPSYFALFCSPKNPERCSASDPTHHNRSEMEPWPPVHEVSPSLATAAEPREKHMSIRRHCIISCASLHFAVLFSLLAGVFLSIGSLLKDVCGERGVYLRNPANAGLVGYLIVPSCQTVSELQEQEQLMQDTERLTAKALCEILLTLCDDSHVYDAVDAYSNKAFQCSDLYYHRDLDDSRVCDTFEAMRSFVEKITIKVGSPARCGVASSKTGTQRVFNVSNYRHMPSSYKPFLPKVVGLSGQVLVPALASSSPSRLCTMEECADLCTSADAVIGSALTLRLLALANNIEQAIAEHAKPNLDCETIATKFLNKWSACGDSAALMYLLGFSAILFAMLLILLVFLSTLIYRHQNSSHSTSFGERKEK